jgi:hypothetical protein
MLYKRLCTVQWQQRCQQVHLTIRLARKCRYKTKGVSWRPASQSSWNERTRGQDSCEKIDIHNYGQSHVPTSRTTPRYRRKENFLRHHKHRPRPTGQLDYRYRVFDRNSATFIQSFSPTLRTWLMTTRNVRKPQIQYDLQLISDEELIETDDAYEDLR